MPWTELAFGPGTWMLLVAAGGLFGMDAVSWPQAMISRPLISATVGGWLLGAPGEGMMLGAVLELYSLRHPPLGAALYPDTGPAGLVAGASYAAVGGDALGPFLVALMIGWALGWIGTVTEHVRRRLNERLIASIGELAASAEILEQRHRLAIWFDALRGAVLVASFMVPAMLLTAVVAGASPSVQDTWAMSALLLGIAASAGAAARSMAFGVRGWPLLLAGGALASLLILGAGW